LSPKEIDERVRVGDDHPTVHGVFLPSRTFARSSVLRSPPTTLRAAAMSSSEGAGGSSTPSSSSACWSSRRGAQSDNETPARSAARNHLAFLAGGTRSSTRSSALVLIPYIVRTVGRPGKPGQGLSHQAALAVSRWHRLSFRPEPQGHSAFRGV